jgi:hypothetical protein
MFFLNEGRMILTPGCRSASANLCVAQSLEAGTRVMIKENKLTHHSQDDSLANEILFMRELTHPNVTKILDAFLLDASVLWIVMDHVNGATLARVIAEHNTLEEKYIACISREVSLARAMVSYHLFFFVLADMQGPRISARPGNHSSRHQVRQHLPRQPW